MPLEAHIALISTIENRNLKYQALEADGLTWITAPPPFLPAFRYYRCRCTGPTSGYQIPLKYDGLICRIDVTAWGLTCRKSTPTHHDMEIIQITSHAPYRVEIVLL